MTQFADLVTRLSDDLREYFEERAAIREFDGGLPRDHAECAALLDTLRRDPLAFAGVTVLQVELAGVHRFVLASDAARLLQMGVKVLGVADLPNAIAEFQGLAELTRFS